MKEKLRSGADTRGVAYLSLQVGASGSFLPWGSCLSNLIQGILGFRRGVLSRGCGMKGLGCGDAAKRDLQVCEMF